MESINSRARLALLAGALSFAFAAWCAGTAQAATTTFKFTGTTEAFTVPPGITTVNVKAVGARGGNGGGGNTPGGAGGLGALATADIPVTPGQLLFVRVGGKGPTGKAGPPRDFARGGFNGGGISGYANDHSGGGGGGASDVRTQAPGDPGSLESRLIVAGGGGGGGGNSALVTGTGGGAGGAAGEPGQPGTAGAPGAGGGGGLATAGGAGAGASESDGVIGFGGLGVSSAMDVSAGSGGGGGGGLFGGGGGGPGSGANSSGGGGGGGSSGFASKATNTSVTADTTGPRSVTFTYGGDRPGPSEFELGKVKKNKRKGTAKLTVEVGGPGTLDLAGNSLKPTSKQAAAAGEVKLKIKAKGKKKRKLNDKGKARVKPAVTYTPTGGAPSTKNRKVKLVKK